MFGIVIMTKKAYDEREELLAKSIKLNEQMLKDWSEAINLNGEMNNFNHKLCDFNSTLVRHIDERDNDLKHIAKGILSHEYRLSRLEKIAACKSGVTVEKFTELEDSERNAENEET